MESFISLVPNLPTQDGNDGLNQEPSFAFANIASDEKQPDIPIAPSLAATSEGANHSPESDAPLAPNPIFPGKLYASAMGVLQIDNTLEAEPLVDNASIETKPSESTPS